jgi:hypothetical protein
LSKNVAIKEGSTSKQFGNAKKLRTNLVGGGTADWVPEDEVQLTSLHITEDGTYNANDEGYYGYNPVTVSGIGSCTFTAEDGDVLGGEELVGGNEYSHDPEDEEDPIKLLPSYIVIEQEPDITEYYDLDPIILMGMKVKAYSNDGVVWTSEEWADEYIPLEEIAFEPIKANKEEATPSATYGEFCLVESGEQVPEVADNFMWSESPIFLHGIKFQFPRGWGNIIVTNPETGVSSSAFSAHNYDEETKIIVWVEHIESDGVDHYTLKGVARKPRSGSEILGVDAVALFSDHTIKRANEQEITIKWDREKDGKPLTDKFVITVIDPPTQSDDDDDFEGGGG